MSGLEVAGVVLGVFPLVVSGLRFYYEGCEKVKEMRHHREVLKEFIREIDMESAKFINTCENLFEDVAPEHVAELTTHCAPDVWRSESVQSRLRARLKGNCVQQFSDSAEKLMTILENMRVKFAHDNVEPNKHSAKKLRKIFNLALLEDYRKNQVASLRKINSDLYQLVNAAILTPPEPRNSAKPKSSSVAVYYKRIRDQAASIYGTVKEKLQPPSCQCQATHVVGMRLEIWKDEGRKSFTDTPSGIKFTLAFTFDQGEQGKAEWRETELECIECEDSIGAAVATPPHVMQKTDSGYFSMVSSTTELEPPPPYRERADSVISLRRQSKLKSVSFSSTSPSNSPYLSPPLKSSKSPSHSPRPSISSASITTPLPEPVITNLCNLLHYHASSEECPPSSSQYTPLGLLMQTTTPHRHRIYPPRPLSSSHPYTTTLHSLLSRASRRNMSTEDRLLLGIKLTNSVLSLHETEWLKDTWSTKDIVFLSATRLGGNPMLERPLVRQILQPATGRPGKRERKTSDYGDNKKQQKRLVQFRNRSLFALGIALIELWYNSPFEQLRQEVEDELRAEADDDDSDDDYDDDEFDEFDDSKKRQQKPVSPFEAAVYIVNAEWVVKDAGRLYGDAVRRCIMGLDVRDTSWESEEFRKGCVEGVLHPLEESFRAFRGEL